MAKAAKVETPQVVFLKNAPNIWKSAFFAALKPLTKLLTVEAEKVMQQAVSDITGKSIFNNLSNYTLFLQTIEIALNHAITDKAIVADNLRINKMKDGRYFFNLIGSKLAISHSLHLFLVWQIFSLTIHWLRRKISSLHLLPVCSSQVTMFSSVAILPNWYSNFLLI